MRRPTSSNSDRPPPTHAANAESDAVASLEAQKAFLRQVLDINPNFIFAKDRDGRFTLVNQAVADVYGTTIDGLIGKQDADFNPNVDEVAFFRRMDLEVMNSQQERFIPEERITDATGHVRWLQTVKRPIIGPDGRANQVLGVSTDITERKRLEELLRHSQKMEALGLLAGGVAHDFNNLLAVILGNADLMTERLNASPAPDPRLVTCVDLMLSAAKRAELLVRQLLAFGRRHPTNPVRIDLNATIISLQPLLQRLIGERIELHCELDAGIPWILADGGQVEQIVMNLVVNGRDAMPKGGQLTISTSSSTLTVEQAATNAGARPGKHVVLTVVDTGVGISPDVIDRIFEPFFTTKPIGHGTGLGLSTVYGIAKQAGGFVTVQSKQGVGTTFRVHLPAVDPPPHAAPPTPAPLAKSGTETILICEDEADVRRTAQNILHSRGYHVLTAGDAAAAIAAAAQHHAPIHLLLTDVVMPNTNGRQLAELLKTPRPQIKVLYMTGYSADVLNPKDDSTCPARVVLKPFTAEQLLAAVREALDAGEATQR